MKSTIGFDFVSSYYHVPDSLTNEKVPVKIWDTAGQERFKTITQSFYRQANGIVVAFDVTNRNSFENVKSWLESINAHANPGIVKILVGNKADLAPEDPQSN